MMLITITVLFTLLLVSGSPVYLFLGLPAVIALLIDLPFPMTIATIAVSELQNFLLSSIPMFIFTGILLAKTNLTKYIFDCLKNFLGHLPGGLALVAIAAATFFGGITGSSAAEATALGLLLVKPMIDAGYERKFVTALLAASGTLAILVPPSTPMIIYGFLAEVSVGKLFIAGIVPALVLGTLLAVYSVWYCVKHQYKRSAKATWEQRIKSVIKGLPVFGMVGVIIGGIYSGIATPTETAAIASIYGLFICVFIYKNITWTLFKEAVLQTARLSCMIFLIIAGCQIMNFALTYHRAPMVLTEWVISKNLSPAMFLFAVNVILLILGIPLEPPPLLMMITPLVAPILQKLGVDLVHFGVIFMINMQIAIASPPVGINLYIISSIAGAPTHEIFRSIIPMCIMMVIALWIITYVPWFSLVLVR